MKLLNNLIAQYTKDTAHLFPKSVDRSKLEASMVGLASDWKKASSLPEWKSGRGQKWGIQLLHAVFAVYQAYFDRLHKVITRIESVKL